MTLNIKNQIPDSSPMALIFKFLCRNGSVLASFAGTTNSSSQNEAADDLQAVVSGSNEFTSLETSKNFCYIMNDVKWIGLELDQLLGMY